jgi:hypothetical protein
MAIDRDAESPMGGERTPLAHDDQRACGGIDSRSQRASRRAKPPLKLTGEDDALYHVPYPRLTSVA